MLVCGMPQEVAEYLKTNNLSRVDKSKPYRLHMKFLISSLLLPVRVRNTATAAAFAPTIAS